MDLHSTFSYKANFLHYVASIVLYSFVLCSHGNQKSTVSCGLPYEEEVYPALIQMPRLLEHRAA